MGLINKKATVNNLSPRQQLESKYSASRANLLLVVVFSAINLFLTLTESDTYFLFSAYIPLIVSGIGMALCGKYPDEYYEGDISEYEFFGDTFFAVMVAIAVGVILLYLLSWLLSKKNVWWMIFSVAFFSIDTVVMLWLAGVSSDMIIDIVFHGWVLISLINGIMSYFKLKKLPEDVVAVMPEETEGVSQEQING